MADYTQTITSGHKLLDYEAPKFINAEVQLKNILPEWINKAAQCTPKLRVIKMVNV